jgi:hypothetical protein
MPKQPRHDQPGRDANNRQLGDADAPVVHDGREHAGHDELDAVAKVVRRGGRDTMVDAGDGEESEDDGRRADVSEERGLATAVGIKLPKPHVGDEGFPVVCEGGFIAASRGVFRLRWCGCVRGHVRLAAAVAPGWHVRIVVAPGWHVGIVVAAARLARVASRVAGPRGGARGRVILTCNETG